MNEKDSNLLTQRSRFKVCDIFEPSTDERMYARMTTSKDWIGGVLAGRRGKNA